MAEVVQKKCTMCGGTGVVKTPGQPNGVTCPRCGGTGIDPKPANIQHGSYPPNS